MTFIVSFAHLFCFIASERLFLQKAPLRPYGLFELIMLSSVDGEATSTLYDHVGAVVGYPDDAALYH